MLQNVSYWIGFCCINSKNPYSPLRYPILLFLLALVGNVKSQNVDSTAPSEVINLNQNQISNVQTLQSLFQKLEKTKSGNERVSILHIGDSHIQGDYLSGNIRVGLQDIFGNSGRGLVFPFALAKSYGSNDVLFSSNTIWTTKRNFFEEDSIPLGISGFAILSNNPNYVLNAKLNYDQHRNSFNKISLLMGNDSNQFDIGFYADDQPYASEFGLMKGKHQLDQPWSYQSLNLGILNDHITLRPLQNSAQQYQSIIYGLVLENSNAKGITYHTAGVGAAQLVNFTRTSLFLDQAAALQPDLVLVSLGTNESYSIYFDTIGYRLLIENTISELRKRLPNAAFIFTTPPDIVYKYRYPKYMDAVCRAIKSAAINQNCAYWDLNQVMGGMGSMNQWHANGLAQNDHIHFKPNGYKLQAYLFMDAFLTAYNEVATAENKVNSDNILTYIKENKPSKKQVAKPAVSAYGATYHVVRQGETLGGIARKHHTTVNRLCQLNGIRSTTLLRIGRRLRVR